MLTLEGKIMIFKTLAISKMVYLALITNVPKVIIKKLQKKKKFFFMAKLTSYNKT